VGFVESFYLLPLFLRDFSLILAVMTLPTVQPLNMIILYQDSLPGTILCLRGLNIRRIFLIEHASVNCNWYGYCSS
jgi:hypothetical protein